MNNDLQMRVMLEIYGTEMGFNQNLRLSEEIQIKKPLNLQEAAEILTRFSELAKSIQR